MQTGAMHVSLQQVNQMKNRILLIGAAGLTAVATAMTFLNQQLNNAQRKLVKYKFDDRNQAIQDGIKREAPSKIDEAVLDEFIVLSAEQDGNQFLVIQAPYEEDGRTKHVVYVATVKEYRGKYAFTRRTANFGLNANGEIEDDDFAYYSISKVENIDGMSFTLGKIYDKYYVPLYEGNRIPVQKNGIFAAMNFGEPPEIDMVHDGEIVIRE